MARRTTWRQIIWALISAVVLLAGVYIYGQWNFPQELRHLSPQKFESHPVRDLNQHIVGWEQMDAKVYNTSLASMCEDVEVSSIEIAYCINEHNQIISIDINNGKISKLATAQKGRSYGIRLSRDEKLLYFANSQLGLCQFDIKTKKITVLASQYQSKRLLALNSIETHPTNPNILYITESSSLIPLSHFNIDILLNNPLGRLFEYSKNTQKLSLVTDGLYFANGIVFQEYKGEQTVLVAELNRFRIQRVYVSGERRGMKQIAIQKLDMYPDNMKANQKGDIWIGAVFGRSKSLQISDYHPWMRHILSRMPSQALTMLANLQNFGGMKISFSNKNTQHQVEYFLWKSLPQFKFSTVANQKNNRLCISSLSSKGVILFDNLRQKLKKTKKVEKSKQEDQTL